MVIAKRDLTYFRTHKVLELRIEYEEITGNEYNAFNYADHATTEGYSCAANRYHMELLADLEKIRAENSIN